MAFVVPCRVRLQLGLVTPQLVKSMSISAHRRFGWSLILEWLQRAGAFITVIAIAVFGFWGGHFLLPGPEHSEAESDVVQLEASVGSSQVTLPSEKLAAADIKMDIARLQEFQAHKAVPGTIVYDATKKVELRATVDCIVKKTLVRSAEQVIRGQPILIVIGPEVGAARSEIRQCESTLELMEKEYAWTLDTHTNMSELLAFLVQSPTSEQVKTQFEHKNLGEHRSAILSVYVELELAKRVASRTDLLESQGAISSKDADQRKSVLDVAAAKYNSIREEMSFQSSQQLTSVKAKLDAERKRLEICREKLGALLGPHTNSTNSQINAGGLAEFVVTAPRDGQIVELQAVESARFEQGEVMAEIADTSDFWIEAQISQRDWYSLKLEPDQQLTVRVPAWPEKKFTAAVKHIGMSVSKSTMAIPVVAELNNADNRFRPGMSIWVDVPTSERRSAFVVPEGAVQRNESQVFVFVQTDDRTFESRKVVLGQESEARIEIKSGLSEGDRVVVEGAFFLKSELLLAEEE